tara:strand:- start:5588 stop:6658 length:1071 start_codon:yes stop_codon:yes gene_type:complete
MIVIYFSAQLPLANIPVAGQKIANNHLKQLGSPSKIIIFSFVNKIEKPFLRLSYFKVFKKTYLTHTNLYRRILNCILNLQYPFKVSNRFYNSVFNDLVNEIILNKVNKIFFEFTSSMLYAKKLRDIFPDLEIHFVEHDVTFQSYKRLSKSNNLFRKLFYSFEYCRIKKFELNNLKKFDFIYTLNNKDLEILKKYRINNISVKYPQVDDWIYKVRRDKIQNKTILFLGAMHRKENQDAVFWFVNKIIPSLIEIHPNLRFYIIGGGVKNNIKKLQSKNIIVTGYVKDLKKYFEFIQIAVVPLNFGAGIKIKTIETVSAKILTISTKIGAEGVNESPFLKIVNSKKIYISTLLKEFENE